MTRVVHGLGDAAAERLAGAFPDVCVGSPVPNLASVLASEGAEAALAQAGLSATLAEASRVAWLRALDADPSGAEAALRGLGEGVWKRARARFGGDLPRVILEAPYRLLEAPGIGWDGADAVARRIARWPPHSAERVLAAVAAVLDAASNEGDCFLPEAEAVARVSKLAKLPEDVVHIALGGVPGRRLTETITRDTARRYWREELLEAETVCASELRRITRARVVVSEAEADRLAREHGSRLTDEQVAAVRQALLQGVSLISGGPGCGKTTVVSALVKAALSAGLGPVRLCAPTALAARRLSSEAVTVHRLVEWGAAFTSGEGEAVAPASGVATGRHAARPIDAGLIIVDEASMLGVHVASKLLAAVRAGGRIVFVGDPSQLPSIEPGNFLHDLLAAGAPQTRLTKVFRFGSHLVRVAHDVREGRIPELARGYDPAAEVYFCPAGKDPVARVVELVRTRIPERFGIPPHSVKVLAAMYRGHVGINALAEALREVALGTPPPSSTAHAGELKPAARAVAFRAGDRITWLRNDRETRLINGDELTVISAGADGSLAVATDAGDEIFVEAKRVRARLAYCSSIHKSQGGEHAGVVVVLPREHSFMLHRALVYTALTRARRLAVVVSDDDTLAYAVRRVITQGRRTLLAARMTPWPAPGD